MALQKKQPLPTWRDLPVTDGIPMDNNNHPIQAETYLGEPLRRFLASQGRSAFIGHNCFLYYEPKRHPAGPDFFVVNDGHDEGQGSWVAYSEGDLLPTLVCELLSPRSEKEDRTTKKERYEKLGAPDYFLYDTEDQRFEGFRLNDDGVYVPATPEPSGRIRCQSLPLELGVVGKWLRWFTPDGQMLLTDGEMAQRERERADAAVERADAAAERADAAAERAAAAAERADAAMELARQAQERANALEAYARELEERLKKKP